jgi:hypothetical protein
MDPFSLDHCPLCGMGAAEWKVLSHVWAHFDDFSDQRDRALEWIRWQSTTQ